MVIIRLTVDPVGPDAAAYMMNVTRMFLKSLLIMTTKLNSVSRSCFGDETSTCQTENIRIQKRNVKAAKGTSICGQLLLSPHLTRKNV